MSRSHSNGRGRGGKGPTYEYWSRRPNSMSSPGKDSKKLTHALERAEAKEELKNELDWIKTEREMQDD